MTRLCSECGHLDIRYYNGKCLICHKRGCAKNRGVDSYESQLTLPSPTDALPGTEEKLQVMIERAAKGQHLWHPDDAKPNAR